MSRLKRKRISMEEPSIDVLQNDCEVTDEKEIKVFIFDGERKQVYSKDTSEKKEFCCTSAISTYKSAKELSVSQSVVPCNVKIMYLKLKQKPINQKLVYSNYLKDIYQYLKEKELKNRPLHTYIRSQPWITLPFRNVLIDTLISIVNILELDDNVLFLSVYYLDRFLSLVFVKGTKLAAVGFACLFIASKYEEASTDVLADFTPFMKRVCTKQEVCRIERKILKTLCFDISGPTAYFFLKCICSSMEVSVLVLFLAMFILEMTFMEPHSFLQFLPSTLAASAIFVANNILEVPSCAKSLQICSGYSENDTSICCKQLHKLYRKFISRPRRSIYEKYKSSEYFYVADLHTNRTV